MYWIVSFYNSTNPPEYVINRSIKLKVLEVKIETVKDVGVQ